MTVTSTFLSYLQASSAGSRDSPLTNHGVLQAQRLGAHLAARSTTIGPIEHIYSSDLRRAAKTAEAIAEAQSGVGSADNIPNVVQLPELREKDFGSDEGKHFGGRGANKTVALPASSYVAHESQEAMKIRVDRFIDENLLSTIVQIAMKPGQVSIVIVAHGIILDVLLRCLLTRFGPDEISKLPSLGDAPWRSGMLATWSNTGYLEAELRVTLPSVHVELERNGSPLQVTTTAGQSPDAISPLPTQSTPSLTSGMSSADIQISVKTVNCIEHRQGLKKTRGGIGSAGFDEKQKTMDSFLSHPSKKPKSGEAAQ